MIRRARRDGREARGNEEREKREDENGSHCFFKSSGYDKLELKHQSYKLIIEYRFFLGKYCILHFKFIECIIKMSWCETKICAIGEQNVIN